MTQSGAYQIPTKPLFLLAAVIWLISPATQSVFLPQPQALSPLVAPSSYGYQVFASAYVILEHMAWWLWPFGRDWALRPLDPNGLFAINLLYWLILVLALRHAWRLRRWNPWVFGGLIWAMLGLVPFSSIIPLGLPPFSQSYLLFSGLGLAVMVASLILQCLAFVRRQKTSLGWRWLYGGVSLALLTWLIGLVFEDARRAPRSLEARIEYTAVTDKGNAIAVAELARIEAARGNVQRAQQLILKAEQVMPWYREIPYIKADIAILHGDDTSARFFLQSILKNNPEDLRATNRLANVKNSKQ
ncbi:MAG: hypothetical protein AAGF10_02745 [Verrucomicrobiota bacterium]